MSPLLEREAHAVPVGRGCHHAISWEVLTPSWVPHFCLKLPGATRCWPLETLLSSPLGNPKILGRAKKTVLERMEGVSGGRPEHSMKLGLGQEVNGGKMASWKGEPRARW